MIEGLRPYPEMQSTGHPWLPSIPTHWEVRRNGRLFSERRETGYPDLPILEVSLRSGVRIRDMEGGKRKQQIADRSVYQRAVKGDIAYNMMRMWQGAVGMAPADGLVSPAYVVATAHEGVDAAYYAYLFRTDDYMKEIDSYSRGIVPDRNRLYWQAFKQMPSAYPPFDEQQLIVRFLDWHGAMSGKLIRTKQRLIALLNEQKQSIIHRAVTQGLDAAAKLKPSGVDWLGDVPEHWKVIRGKNIFSTVDVRSETGTETLLTVSSRNGVVRRDDHQVYMFKAASYVGHKLCWPEDLVINSLWAWANGLGISRHHGIISTAYSVYRLKPGFRDFWQFLDLALRSGAYDWEFQVRSKGIWKSRLQLSDASFLAMPVLLPPMEEAQAIVEGLASETKTMDDAINSAQNEIALIQEFRTRLIADVVTGQLDVRAVAANLPDVAEAKVADLTDDDDLDDDADDLIDEEEAA